MEEIKDLKELIKKELKEVGTKGLTTSNLDSTSKLVDMLKDLAEIESEKKEYMRSEGSYNGPQYPVPPYPERQYREYGQYMDPQMSRGGGGGGGRSYNGYDPRMKDRIERIIDGAETYEYGRNRYQHGGSHEAMEEGLEKMMYAVCMLVETAMDAAQSPREKEIVRKHIQKLRAI